MTLVSYAQNYEDVMLWRALKNVKHGFYIDVGAAWPEQDSVTKLFFDAGWSGMNIEPNPDFITHYARLRPRDINLQVALSDASGTQTMGFIGQTGLSSLAMNVLQTHANQGFDVHTETVEITTLVAICEQYAAERPIHFLKVDVEGYERQVLLGNDWQRFRPWIVVVEATVPLQQQENYHQWESILLSADYEFVYADGLNRFYLAQEQGALKDAFKYPPNYFDGFVLPHQLKFQETAHELAVAKQQLADLTAHLAAVNISISWRITYPLRLLKSFARAGIKQTLWSGLATISTAVKNTFRALFNITYVSLSRWPRSQQNILKLAAQHPRLKQYVTTLHEHTLIFPQNLRTTRDLSPHARQMYHALQHERALIESQTQGRQA
jgi:FkbM family methyltransferase